MRRLILCAAVVLCGVGLAEASITYNLVSPEDSFVITGTVTTNGHLGLLTPSDLLAWNWNVSYDGKSYGANSLEAEAWTLVSNAWASATSIEITYNDFWQSTFMLRVSDSSSSWESPDKFLGYGTYVNHAGQIGPEDSWADRIWGGIKPANSEAWDMFGNLRDYATKPETTFLVATVSENNAVPEPTTLIVWSLLGGLAIAYGWRRKRKA